MIFLSLLYSYIFLFPKLPGEILYINIIITKRIVPNIVFINVPIFLKNIISFLFFLKFPLNLL